MATLTWLEGSRSRAAPCRGVNPTGSAAVITPDDDAALMLRYAGGDLCAFEALYARHRGPLYRYLMRHTHDADAAADLFQEVWSKVIAHRSRYEPRAKFQTFLFRIAYNCCIDHHRRRAARPQVSDPQSTAPDEDPCERLPAPEADQPEERVARAEITARYRAALAELPQAQRDVFLLCEQSDLTLEEVASIMGVGTETAKSRLRYALAKLRRALAPLKGLPAAECAAAPAEPEP